LQHFFEASDGTVYVSSGSSSGAYLGIYVLTPTTATRILTTGGGWQHFFESAGGTVYVSSGISGSEGIYALTPASAALLFPAGYSYTAGQKGKNIVFTSAGGLRVTFDGQAFERVEVIAKPPQTPALTALRVISLASGLYFFAFAN
jgi:hypothetical protein